MNCIADSHLLGHLRRHGDWAKDMRNERGNIGLTKRVLGRKLASWGSKILRHVINCNQYTVTLTWWQYNNKKTNKWERGRKNQKNILKQKRTKIEKFLPCSDLDRLSTHDNNITNTGFVNVICVFWCIDTQNQSQSTQYNTAHAWKSEVCDCRRRTSLEFDAPQRNTVPAPRDFPFFYFFECAWEWFSGPANAGKQSQKCLSNQIIYLYPIYSRLGKKFMKLMTKLGKGSSFLEARFDHFSFWRIFPLDWIVQWFFFLFLHHTAIFTERNRSGNDVHWSWNQRRRHGWIFGWAGASHSLSVHVEGHLNQTTSRKIFWQIVLMNVGFRQHLIQRLW
jgi:hypothetical protein